MANERLTRLGIVAVVLGAACADPAAMSNPMDLAGEDLAASAGGDLASAADLAPDLAPGLAPDLATSGGSPHPLYAALELDSLPGAGGGASGAYQSPTLPTTTRTVTVQSTGTAAAAELLAACQIAGTAVTVPSAAGSIGVVNLGNVEDCDITLGPDVIISFLYAGNLPGPTRSPVHRVRIRGGQLGSLFVAPQSTDLVFDGVILNNAVLPPAERAATAIYLINDDAQSDGFVNRFAMVNSIIRMVATLPNGSGDTDGSAFLGGKARNVFFANNNVVTAGNRNAWGFRFSGGQNLLVVDNTVRVAFHKLVRLNDAPVDYLYVKGGTWMREATLTAGGLAINDSFAQIGDDGADRIYVHDPIVYLLSDVVVGFGATSGPGQVGKSWEARRIGWHAHGAGVVSEAILQGYQSGCASGASCDYGLGTHTYTYDADLAFPTDAWRTLPTISDGNPDHQPIAP